MEQRIQHGAIGAALQAGRRIAIEAVFADIEEEGRKVFVAELGQRTDISVEVEIIDGLAQSAVEPLQQAEHVPLKLGHFRHRHALVFREAFKCPQQIAVSVAQLAILVRHAAKDFLADAVVLGEIDRERPEPQDIRTVIAHQINRADRVAQRLGHFHALLVHREAVRQHRIIRRAAPRGARFEQRGLEPAAMLVRSFKIEIGGP